MDLIDIVWRTEEVFDLKIPDNVAATLTTPRRVIDFVHGTLEGRRAVTKHVDLFFELTEINWYIKIGLVTESGWDRELVAEVFWRLLVAETAIDRSKHTEDSRFVEDMNLD